MANDNVFMAVYNNPAFTVASTSEVTILTASGGNLNLSMPNNMNLNGLPFTVKVIGTCKPGSAGTTTIKLYEGTTKSGTAIASTGASSSSANGCNFCLGCDLIWDSVSQVITGEQWGWIGNSAGVTVLTPATITGVVSSITSLGSIVFAPSITFSAGSNGTVTVNEFSLEQI